jgi:GNAT superfamily N-acetyltransferase
MRRDQGVRARRHGDQAHDRGRGIASKVLRELETWAGELSYKKCILETGIRQQEAVGLYKMNRYVIIPNYGQYAGIENSVCFEKELV